VSRDDLRDTVRGFVKDELLGENAPEDLGDDTPLLSSGLVDSLGLEQLLWFVEDEFGLEFAEADLTAENFESLASIARLLQRKLGDPEETVAEPGGA
jgi:acyl carrier protein